MRFALIAALCLAAVPAFAADPAFAPYSQDSLKTNGSHRAIGGTMLPQPRYQGAQPVYRVHQLPEIKASAPIPKG